MNTKYKTPILLVEDNPEDAAIMDQYLADAGIKYELYRAESLFEATQLLERVQIELVLLDLNLPDSSGFKTLSTYMERAPNVPVVVVTAMNNEIIGNQAIKAGAQDFLVKGQFDSRLFGRTLRYSLQRSKVKLQLEKTARELETNRKRFQEAQTMAHFGTWEMDLVSNVMTWSDEVFRIFSFLPGSFKPSLSEYLNYVPAEDRPQVEAFFEHTAKDGKLHALEHRILVEGINIRYVAIQGKVQIEELTNRIILVGSIQDITERKLSEKLLIEKNISKQTVKIQEEVLSNLGFQIRTPLSSIVNLLFLLEKTRTTTQQHTYVNDLKMSVNDLSIAVNNLLNFSLLVSDNVKIEEEDMNIREFFSGVRNVLKIKADAGNVTIEGQIDETLPEKIISDPRKLTQVLYNLLEYAVRTSHRLGTVQVLVKGNNLPGTRGSLGVVVRCPDWAGQKSDLQELLQSEKLLQQETDDTTPVLSKKQLSVAIASKLVKMMGGTMKIENTNSHGMEFELSIPVKVARQTRMQAGDAPDSPLKILLVEDHFLNQIATKKVLTSWSGYVAVDIAENGLIAVEKFLEYGYDLILMDIQMPVMNGLDAARKIREHSKVPIIALTANSTRQEQDKCLEIGMNDYLSKPFKPEELYARIMNIMSLVPN